VELFAGLFATTAGATNDVERFVGGSGARMHDLGGVQIGQGDIASEGAVNLAKLDGRANVDDLNWLASQAFGIEITRMDCGDRHGNLLRG
jgi:hypothetical protein